MDMAFNDDQMRARTGHAAHNLATLKHMTLNLTRIDPVKRKGEIKARRPDHSEQLLHDRRFDGRLPWALLLRSRCEFSTA
jgi:hypothetical protein